MRQTYTMNTISGVTESLFGGGGAKGWGGRHSSGWGWGTKERHCNDIFFHHIYWAQSQKRNGRRGGGGRGGAVGGPPPIVTPLNTIVDMIIFQPHNT